MALPEGIVFPDWEIQRKHDTLLVVCTGRNVWEDVGNSGWDRGQGFDILCVKDTLVYFPGNVDHSYSEHADQLPLLSRMRQTRRKIIRLQRTKLRHHTGGAIGDAPYVHNWHLPPYGCSGLSACVVGIALGYHRVILAGSPLLDNGHFYDPIWKKTTLERSFPETPKGGPKLWRKVNDEVFEGRVKSMSGRSKDLLGGP